MPPGVGSSVATVAVADAVEDHPRLRFEDCCTDLLSEPVSGDADGRFDRLEEVEVGVSRSQLVGDGLDEVARPRTRLRQVAEDDGLDGAEAVVRLDQRPWVRRSRAVAVLPWSRCDAVELLVEVGEAADVLAVDGEREFLDACGPAADAGGVGVAAGGRSLSSKTRTLALRGRGCGGRVPWLGGRGSRRR